jgi:glutamate racemase
MEPAIKPAAIRSKSRIIGVLATKGTLKGKLYRSTLKKYASDVKVIEQIGEGLVKLVETGQTESPAAMELLKKYLRPMINQGADYIVLGCTHYPFLQKSIEKITKGSVHIINPAPAIARRVKSIISGRDKSYSGVGKTTFYTTGSDETIMKNIIHSIQYLT